MEPAFPQEYLYRQKSSETLCLGLVFAMGTAIALWIALTNDDGMVIRGIRLSPFQARTVYWIVSVAFGSLTCAEASAAILARLFPQRIVLTATAIHVPKSRWSLEVIEIPYATITKLSYSTTKSHIKAWCDRLTTIAYQSREVTIMASRLPAGAYETVCQALKTKTTM